MGIYDYRMIPEKLLLKYGGWIEKFGSCEMIFQQGQCARNFYQIKDGQIQMTTFNDDGKKFIQGIFLPGESFGEPPLFADIAYAANAHALVECELIVIPKESFLEFLELHPKYYLVMLKRLSLRLKYKATVAQLISNEYAETRILSLIDYLKNKEGIKKDEHYQVSLTRQQIGELIGLRVETVIRTISVLKEKKLLTIKGGKIIR